MKGVTITSIITPHLRDIAHVYVFFNHKLFQSFCVYILVFIKDSNSKLMFNMDAIWLLVILAIYHIKINYHLITSMYDI